MAILVQHCPLTGANVCECQHCMSLPDTSRNASADAIFQGYPAVDLNHRTTDIQAAIGGEQLKHFPEIVDRRRELAARYRSLPTPISGLVLPREPEGARSDWLSDCVPLPSHVWQRVPPQRHPGKALGPLIDAEPC